MKGVLVIVIIFLPFAILAFLQSYHAEKRANESRLAALRKRIEANDRKKKESLKYLEWIKSAPNTQNRIKK